MLDLGSVTAEHLEHARSEFIAHISELAHLGMSLAELADFRALEAFAAVDVVVAGLITKEGVPEAIAKYEEAKRLSDEASERLGRISEESKLQEMSDTVSNYWLAGRTK